MSIHHSRLALEPTQYFLQNTHLFTKNSINRIRRHWIFVNYSDETAYRPRMAACGAIFAGVVIGGIAGTLVINSTREWISKHPLIVHLTKALGFSIGAMVGGTTGVYIYMAAAEKAPDYIAWRENNINNVLSEAMELKYRDDPVLKNFICPLSGCVMFEPVRSPHGHIFENKKILACETGPLGNIKNPLNNIIFNKNELLLDHEMAVVVSKRAVLLIRSDFLQFRDQPDLKKAVDAEIARLTTLVKKTYREAKNVVDERLDSQIITRAQFQIEQQSFWDCFNDSPNIDLEWEKEWGAVLDQRWVYFHPGAVILG